MKNLDKVYHYIFGSLIVVLCVSMGLEQRSSLLIVILISASKEIYDSLHQNHTSDGSDFTATVVGGLSAIIILQ